MLLSVRRVSMVLATALLVQIGSMSVIQSQPAMAAEAVDLKLDAKSAILMDAATGQILYEFNSDTALPPASMSKMMTEYLVMESVKSGKHKLDDMVPTSQYAADVIGSGDLLAFKEQVSLKDMFSAMSIYSANDASVALAEFISGSTEEDFAKMMNEKAKQFGLSDQAHFINATGLSRADLGKYAPKELQGETMLTAKDAALIAYNLIKDYPEILETTKIPSKKFREKDKTPMINWNWMLEGNKDNTNFKKYAYPGLDGLKTGSTDDAGYCFTGTAVRNGVRLISVVMGTPKEPKRFEETRKVLDYGFNNFEKKQVLAANSEIDSLKVVNIKKGIELQVGLATQEEVSLVAKKGAAPEEFKITAAAVDESKLVAPITKGDVLGTVKVNYQGYEKTTNLIATADVVQASWFRLMFRAIGSFFSDMLAGAKS
ncbi:MULTISPECIES: D-alanyl-D-alanine carboxypeptidase family protein [Paenibacillus]|uniref:serine-type D-Ala-D-Ala carboxypeptidase n=1 Tax=Paenibacillus baimaensis TaxID=2982185 RepID=A0ABT2UEJ7_9BACL|nr:MULTISPECIES: D-alanyl-D-alanine carboxypeptidase family protein [unclassified Paenibacillus]MCU6793068.1 D-alanyl-D-alanine carboxypeptidase [Paenibacillus sp. WQ 127069]OMF13205.1 D-alanyl-D-alanine carboxypeptidase [Paenibacillus sp. FSL H7-0331]